MGVVYRALDPKIGRTLAIKSIRLNELTDPEERGRMRERLFREAQSAGILSHPNIVTIYDVSEEEGMAYIFMEFVNGMALDELLRAAPPPTGALVMDLLTQTAAALDYAHKNGIIHRDIKPANIMVHEGRTAKVCDFGVAKIVSQQMTQAGMLMGTPSYMSPEQIEGRPMDGRSDQFALAVMVFDILTKEKPFAGESLPILLYKICRADPPSASGLNTTLGIWVDPVLRKALAKNPDERYPSCSAFITELRRALEERPGWMLPGKGFPGDDTTTGSGHHESEAATSGAIPVARSGSLSAGSIISGAALVGATSSSAVPQPPPFAPGSSGSASLPTLGPTSRVPAPPPPPLAPPPPAPTFHNVPVLGAAAGSTIGTEAIPLPRRRDEPKRSSPLLYVILLVLVAGAGGYFVYQKYFEPKPVVENPENPAKPGETKPVAQAPEIPKVDVPKETPAKPAEPTTPEVKEPKPNVAAAGPFDVSFAGSPAGVNVVIDGDPSIPCKIPCSIPLSKGRHTFAAAIDGYRSMQRSFEVTGETTVPVDMVATVGILVVKTSPPGATIQLNGQERPEKTPAELHIKPGTYQVVIISPDGRRDSSTVTVRDGMPGTLNVNFP